MADTSNNTDIRLKSWLQFITAVAGIVMLVFNEATRLVLLSRKWRKKS